MPDSHQEINAEEFADKHAAIILNQADISDDIFIATVRSLLHDPEKQSSLSKNIKHIVKVDTQSQNINIIKNLLKFS
jgi:UDP-N-acetylglucosamine:LPS N-acetylglucosamine transferase